MLRFRLGRIPVRVHASHLLFSALIGLLFLPAARQLSPYHFPALASLTESTAQAIVTAGFVLSWVFIVFISVLIHELGHAVTSLWFGYKPEVELVWMGGHTRPNAEGPISWKRDILITLAGPIAGASLGVAAFVALLLMPERSLVVQHLLSSLWTANLFWAVLNLIPVMPLDGGRISMVGLSHFFGQKGFIASQGAALLVSAGMILFSLQQRWIFATVFFASYALQAWQLLQAGQRGEAGPDAEAPRPGVEQLQGAARALDEGRLDDARAAAGPLTSAGNPPRVRGFAEKILGWAALKEGAGRTALEHFARAAEAGVKIENEALAAGLSLDGNDLEALSLWEQAYRESRDRTVMHEWAGALWREGKKGAALGLPGIDPVQAASCAVKVPYIRGDFERAAKLGEEALATHPHPATAYDAACAYARAGKQADALRLLKLSESLGFDEQARVLSDPDLQGLRGMPAFELWAETLGTKSVALTER